MTAVALVAIPAALAAGPSRPAMVSLDGRSAVWAPGCRQPEGGRLAAGAGTPVPGVGPSCDLTLAPGGVLLADDLRRGGRLVAWSAAGLRVLSPPGLAVRTPVSPSPDGTAVAYCSDVPHGAPAERDQVLLVSRIAGGTRMLGAGCDPAWIPSGLAYVSTFVHSFAESYGDTISLLPDGSHEPYPLARTPGITQLIALPGMDELGALTAQPGTSQTLTLISPHRGTRWLVKRIVDGVLNVAAPMRGSRFTVAASNRVGATRLYLADAARRTLRPLGAVATGRALWSIDGRVLIWATPRRWRVYDPASGRLLAAIPGHGVFAALR